MNSIHPGFIWTPMVETHLSGLGDLQKGRETVAALHPLGHLGEPDDISWGAVYLASDEARFVTGTELVIDGGYTALIAWKDSREARRALSAILPLLQRATSVTILSLGEADALGEELGDLVHFLPRHEIKAEPVVAPRSEIATANRILGPPRPAARA